MRRRDGSGGITGGDGEEERCQRERERERESERERERETGLPCEAAEECENKASTWRRVKAVIRTSRLPQEPPRKFEHFCC